MSDKVTDREIFRALHLLIDCAKDAQSILSSSVSVVRVMGGDAGPEIEALLRDLEWSIKRSESALERICERGNP